ncbi:putative ABC transport system ATP-binding protein [Parasphingorhabdus marina DSM 22363]|uniref:Putative ABC transport system ATP-binding protein n=1 Tax=Parasphingorhabdus marina DSM 22363 TaxID=1123272 RepID=A0A1N6EIA3_9SPHN|nr:ATP-binding cassette domain-containing protein [Parasphingorhabdus marina]SIN82724.1 putative ABC transport system ATP-binding protein [Parasphingorhabdus marina DSM 22363]
MQLQVDAIGKSYGTTAVLKGVSFSLSDGEQALLLGPSGSGKSTLLNIICGLQRPDQGSVAIDNQVIASPDSTAKSDEVRRTSLGIVFQTLRLVSALSLRANLELAQKLQTGRVDSGLIDESLDRLDISHRAGARPFQLSQGEAQRAAIARAVVVSPKLLIADEPTSALDRENTRRVAELLIEMAKTVGAGLLIATHDDRLGDFFPQNYALDQGELKSC